MSTYDTLPSLRPYVTGVPNKNLEELNEAALRWLVASAKNKISYEIDWLGVPVIQTPQDLVLLQEVIFNLKPDFIIETGVAHGGSLIFHASIMELLNHGSVIGVDVEIRAHNRAVLEQHPLFKRITLIEGDSVGTETLGKIKQIVPAGAKTIVFLDSNHTKDHVLKELRSYQSFVPLGSYLIVSDTFTDEMVKHGAADDHYRDNGPMAAVTEFWKTTDAFAVDEHYDRLFVSYSPRGFLKRVK